MRAEHRSGEQTRAEDWKIRSRNEEKLKRTVKVYIRMQERDKEGWATCKGRKFKARKGKEME